MIVCIGAANVDIKTRAAERLVLGSSNPTRSYISAGGVARNISENLTRLGAEVKLISRVGNDAHGQWLLAHFCDQKIDRDGISVSPNSVTATYTALLEPDGEMLIASAEMDIINEVTPHLLDAYSELLRDAKFLIVDSNLSEETLKHIKIYQQKDRQLWSVVVSVCKTKKLSSILPYLTGIILNQDEFFVLADKPKTAAHSFQVVQDACKELLTQGIKVIVVTCGKTGAYLATKDQFLFFQVEELLKVEDVTGAGDAFAAGFIFGLHKELPLDKAIAVGLAAARFTLGTHDTVHHLLSEQCIVEQLKHNFYQVVRYK